MLQLGVFGGKYMTDCRSEFPTSWFARAKLCSDDHDPKLNFFGVDHRHPPGAKPAVQAIAAGEGRGQACEDVGVRRRAGGCHRCLRCGKK